MKKPFTKWIFPTKNALPESLWRMITGCIMKPPVMMEWIPSGIILGLRMGVAEENLVVSMAKEAGIKNIYKSYINAQNKLDAYPLKL